MSKAKTPKRIYKYKGFSSLTMSMIINDQVHFSDPSTFNDPLDTKPTIEADVCNIELEIILQKLIEQRSKNELINHARAIRLSESKIKSHIIQQIRNDFNTKIISIKELAHILYDEIGENLDEHERYRILLEQYIEEELLKRYNKGIFCLTENDTCPLMWSHYGDQHRGIALGYSLTEHSKDNLHKVKYGGSRIVKASSIKRMLDEDLDADNEVDSSVLLKKAQAWRYEKEWRLLGERGLQASPLELEEIVFGLRCPDSVIFTIVRALNNRERPVKFYQIRGEHGRFYLKKRVADIDELMETHPRRHAGIYEHFRQLENI